MIRLITTLLLVAMAGAKSPASAVMPVPQPAQYTATPGSYTLPATLTVAADGTDARKIAATATGYLTMRGLKSRTGRTSATADHESET